LSQAGIGHERDDGQTAKQSKRFIGSPHTNVDIDLANLLAAS